MPRQPRLFVNGATYHVFCRVGRGEPVFRNDAEAEVLVKILKDVKQRDGLAVLAWCVMSNHYHLALRTGRVPLWRTMRLIQGRYSKAYNRGRGVYGPLWEGRYKAKLVLGERHLQQLILYVHLNPLVARVVKDPARYRWSGHRELLGGDEQALVDADEALLAFGETREAARRAYQQGLAGAARASWSGSEPGRLPWWKRGGEGDSLSLSERTPRLDALGASNASEPRLLSPDEYVVAAANVLGLELGALAGPRSGRELTRLREMVALVGVEMYALKIKELAHRLGKNPGVVSRWASVGGERRVRDDDFRERIERFAAEIRVLTTPAQMGESDFVSGVTGSFID